MLNSRPRAAGASLSTFTACQLTTRVQSSFSTFYAVMSWPALVIYDYWIPSLGELFVGPLTRSQCQEVCDQGAESGLRLLYSCLLQFQSFDKAFSLVNLMVSLIFEAVSHPVPVRHASVAASGHRAAALVSFSSPSLFYFIWFYFLLYFYPLKVNNE